jgi:hypothetical protein
LDVSPRAESRKLWNLYSQVVHKHPDIHWASQTQSVSGSKNALKNFGGDCKLFVKIA